MSGCINYGLSVIRERFGLERLSIGKYADLRMNPLMKFHVDRYHIPELGNLTVMKTNMALMQMCTFLIAPYESNVPLMSINLIYIMGKRKFLIEFYDLVGNKQSESYKNVIAILGDMSAGFSDVTDMPENDGNSAWLKTCRPVFLHKQFTINEDVRGMEMFSRALCTYLDMAKKTGISDKTDRKAQLENTRDYVDRLLNESGISTKMFRKAFGDEMTRDFYENVFFGCGSLNDN